MESHGDEHATPEEGVGRCRQPVLTLKEGIPDCFVQPAIIVWFENTVFFEFCVNEKESIKICLIS
jgi:hypothetical protein